MGIYKCEKCGRFNERKRCYNCDTECIESSKRDMLMLFIDLTDGFLMEMANKVIKRREASHEFIEKFLNDETD